MNIIVIGGFALSGKTALILKLARRLAEKSPSGENSIYIIQNEPGSGSVGCQALESAGFRVENISGGCLCCAGASTLSEIVRAVKSAYAPEHLIIEAQALSDIRAVWKELTRMGLSVSTAAAVELTRLIKPRAFDSPMLKAQLAGAENLILTKRDLVNEEEARIALGRVREYNTEARIFEIGASDDISGALLQALTD